MKLVQFLFLVLFLFATSTVSAQFRYPSLSPSCEINQQIGYTNLNIKYNRPSVRERTIFGGLVPWNKMWVTGAGSPTTFVLDTDVIINKKPLKAGTYFITSIPTPMEWTIIFNGSNKVHTDPGFLESPDVMTFKVPVEKSGRFYETFTISIDAIRGNAKFYLNWADTQVSFTLETTADELINDHIKKNLSVSTEADDYFMAANYYYFQNECLGEGLVLAQRAVELEPSYIWHRKAVVNLGIRLNDFDVIKQATREAMNYYKKNPTDDQDIIDYWKKVAAAKSVSDLK